jgi:hypothetical protein
VSSSQKRDFFPCREPKETNKGRTTSQKKPFYTPIRPIRPDRPPDFVFSKTAFMFVLQVKMKSEQELGKQFNANKNGLLSAC